MQQVRSISKTRTSFPATSQSIGYGTVVTALLAVLVVQYFRVDQHRHLLLMCSEVVTIATLTVFICYLTRKRFTAKQGNLNLVHAICVSQMGAVFVVATFFVWQFVARQCGLGDANEVVALLTLQYVALFLALVGVVPGYDRASLALNGALVFFVCCMTQRFEIFVLAGVFTVIGLWGLLGLYWSRLDSKAIDGQSKMLSIHGSSIGIASLLMLMAIGIACLIPMSDTARALRGFMPFSGGDDGYQDEFALDGVGDGDMLTGGDNATTTGAVDTDQFIEDHKPSLYDVMSEKFDGPVAKQRQNRAIALEAVSKHLHELKQSEIAGKTFRTMRKSGKPTDKKLEDKTTDALFFVEGSAPARFATTHYQHFDGWDWTKADSNSASPQPPKIVLNKKTGKPVFSLRQGRKSYLTNSRIHRVKLMRLETSSLPMASLLDSWHIAKVDNVDFFNWDNHDQICFDGEFIPPQTVIDMKSFAPNYHVLRSRGQGNLRIRQGSPRQGSPRQTRKALGNATEKPESIYLQLPADSQQSSIDAQVAQWTDGIDSDWKQVESIVSHMRTDFELNNFWEVDQSTESSIELFLDQQGGPSYMFATTCAMALRRAGFNTRLASGFVIRENDFDRVAKQSMVTGDNVHVWPEVCLDGQFWIPVEPTPGYPMPYSVETLWQRFVAAIFLVSRWIANHPLSTIATLGLVIFTFAFRVRFVTAGLLLWWHLVRLFWASALLSATRRLIDARFWAAGLARPASQTISGWYSQVDPSLPGRFFELWNVRNFSNSTPAVGNDVVVASCYEQVQLLTYQKIRRFQSENRIGEL